MKKYTDWSEYKGNPDSFFIRYFFLDLVIKAYTELLNDIKFEEPIKILELGCGTGYTSRWLSKKYRTNKITLIDSNKKMLNLSKKY